MAVKSPPPGTKHLSWKEWLAAAPTFTDDAVCIEESEPLSLDQSIALKMAHVTFYVSGNAKWRDIADEGPKGDQIPGE